MSSIRDLNKLVYTGIATEYIVRASHKTKLIRPLVSFFNSSDECIGSYVVTPNFDIPETYTLQQADTLARHIMEIQKASFVSNHEFAYVQVSDLAQPGNIKFVRTFDEGTIPDYFTRLVTSQTPEYDCWKAAILPYLINRQGQLKKEAMKPNIPLYNESGENTKTAVPTEEVIQPVEGPVFTSFVSFYDSTDSVFDHKNLFVLDALFYLYNVIRNLIDRSDTVDDYISELIDAVIQHLTWHKISVVLSRPVYDHEKGLLTMKLKCTPDQLNDITFEKIGSSVTDRRTFAFSRLNPFDFLNDFETLVARTGAISTFSSDDFRSKIGSLISNVRNKVVRTIPFTKFSSQTAREFMLNAFLYAMNAERLYNYDGINLLIDEFGNTDSYTFHTIAVANLGLFINKNNVLRKPYIMNVDTNHVSNQAFNFVYIPVVSVVDNKASKAFFTTALIRETGLEPKLNNGVNIGSSLSMKSYLNGLLDTTVAVSEVLGITNFVGTQTLDEEGVIQAQAFSLGFIADYKYGTEKDVGLSLLDNSWGTNDLKKSIDLSPEVLLEFPNEMTGFNSADTNADVTLNKGDTVAGDEYESLATSTATINNEMLMPKAAFTVIGTTAEKFQINERGEVTIEEVKPSGLDYISF